MFEKGPNPCSQGDEEVINTTVQCGLCGTCEDQRCRDQSPLTLKEPPWLITDHDVHRVCVWWWFICGYSQLIYRSKWNLNHDVGVLMPFYQTLPTEIVPLISMQSAGGHRCLSRTYYRCSNLNTIYYQGWSSRICWQILWKKNPESYYFRNCGCTTGQK